MWEGIGKEVTLEQGKATITLTLDNGTAISTEDSPLANRNLDLVMRASLCSWPPPPLLLNARCCLPACPQSPRMLPTFKPA